MTDGVQKSAPSTGFLIGAALWLALCPGCQKASPAEVPPLPQQPLQGVPEPAREQAEEPPVPSDPTAIERTRFDLDGKIITADARDGEAIRIALERRIGELTDEHRELLRNSVRPGELVLNADSMSIGDWGLYVSGVQLRLLHRTGPGEAPAYGADVSKTGKGWEVGPVEPVFIRARRH